MLSVDALATLRLQPVILCGGAGARLWPLSDAEHPKPFLKLLGDVSLLEAAARRLGGQPIVVANSKHHYLLPQAQIILEPMARNTAPAIAAAALLAKPGAILVVMPSDHLIDDDEGFARSVMRAASLAEAGWICVLGVAPDRPSPAFGYIVPGDEIDGGATVARFVEKPGADTAAQLIAEGALWNAGIVVAKASVVTQALRAHAPAILAAVEAAIAAAQSHDGALVLDAACFAKAPAISFDHAVLELHTRLAVIRLDANWRDVGTWTEMAELHAPDDHGNRVQGEAVMLGCEASFIHSGKRKVIALGLKNIIVVDTPEGLLVAQAEAIGLLGEAVALLAKKPG